MKTTLEDWSTDGRKNPEPLIAPSEDYLHPRSKEIHGKESALAIFWRRHGFKALGIIFSIFVILYMIFGERASIVRDEGQKILQQLEKIEIVKTEVGQVKEERRPEAREERVWKKDQRAALARIRANQSVAKALIKSQEKIILRSIKAFYASNNKGRLCITWKGKKSCRSKKDALNFRLH